MGYNKLSEEIVNRLKLISDKKKTKVLQRFFKTGPGEYGEGDIFWGISVPNIRNVAKNYSDISLPEIEALVRHPVHEVRFCGLLLLMQKAKKDPQNSFKIYLKNTKYINNWDLVDLSAEHIVGAYLFNKNKKILRKLVKSKSLWERRIAIISTYYFIKKKKSKITLDLTKNLLKDKYAIIHKAVGWMLREVGNKCSQETEEKFLQKFAAKMPRVMLRYAIEKFSQEKKTYYLGLR